MADSGKTTKNTPGKDEMPMETRLLLTFVLVGLVLVGSQFLFKPKPGPKPVTKPAAAANPAQAVKPAAPVTPPSALPANAVTAAAEQPFVVDTNLYRVEFSNRGAVVRSWVLKKYRDSAGKPLQLVNAAATSRSLYPFSLDLQDTELADQINKGGLFLAKPQPDQRGIDYEYSNARVTVRKSFRFLPDSYLVQVQSEVLQNGAGLPHFLTWRGGFGDAEVQNAAAVQHTLYFDPAHSSPTINEAKAAKNGPVTNSGSYLFAGLEDTYFAAVFLPAERGQLSLRTYSDGVPAKDNKDEPRVGAGIGGEARNQLSLFVGPKDIDLLRRVNPKLSNLVDFGWFWFVAKPLFLALNWTNNHLTHNIGWAIVLVTLLINTTILLPFKIASFRSSKTMQTLQPQIQAINNKYKGLSLTDPRKQQQNEEIMALYKRHGVNPAGGCLPVLLQMPFFFAFYKVLSVAIEMRGAQWLWVPDLSQPETLAIHVLPLLLLGTQVLMQKMTPAPSTDPAQARMMMFMPLMMGYFFYFQSAGLVLYWLTGNVIGIVQQWFFNRTHAAPEVIPPAPATKSPASTKSGSKR